MDTSTLILVVMAVTLVGVTYQARRLGNERRDVALLGALAGLCGMGSALAAAL